MNVAFPVSTLHPGVHRSTRRYRLLLYFKFEAIANIIILKLEWFRCVGFCYFRTLRCYYSYQGTEQNTYTASCRRYKVDTYSKGCKIVSRTNFFEYLCFAEAICTQNHNPRSTRGLHRRRGILKMISFYRELVQFYSQIFRVHFASELEER